MNSKMQCGLRNLITLLTVLSLAACTTLQTVPAGQNTYANTVMRGDQVRVTTRDGRVHQFKVNDVTANEFSGDGQTVAFADVTQLEKRQPATGKTVALIAIIVGLGVAAAAGGGGSGGGGGY